MFTSQNTYIYKRGKHHKPEDDKTSNADAIILGWCLEHADWHSNHEEERDEDGIYIVNGSDGLP